MFDMTPLPGDPPEVTSQGRKMVTAADKMQRAAASLRAVASRASFRSEAVEAMRRNAQDLAEVMGKAEVRYRDTGNALLDYAPALDEAQKKAKAAIALEGSADVVGATAVAGRTKLESMNPLLSPEEQAQADADHRRAEAELARQASVVATARSEYAQAKADRDRAATAAVARIHSANERSGLNDRFADDFKGFKDKYLVPVLEAVTTVLDVVSKFTTAVAIAAAFIPGLQPLALALAAVGRGLAVVSTATLLLQFAIGEKSLGAVAAGLLFLAGAKLVKVAKGKPPVKDPTFVERVASEAGWKEGLRTSTFYLKNHPVDWSAGAEAVGNEVLVEQPKGLLKDLGKDWVEGQVDSMVNPADVWSTDTFVTHDVAAVGSDFSAVDPGSIVASAFGDAGDAPISVCREPAGVGGGGGGW